MRLPPIAVASSENWVHKNLVRPSPDRTTGLNLEIGKGGHKAIKYQVEKQGGQSVPLEDPALYVDRKGTQGAARCAHAQVKVSILGHNETDDILGHVMMLQGKLDESAV